MRFLITGNMAYVGSVLTANLKEKYPQSELLGFDSAFFAGCLADRSSFPEHVIDHQFFGDVRNFPEAILEGVDTVIHLAAISNDPMGKEFENVTEQINYRQTIEIAKKARNAGVKRFVFASSCSVYGFAGDSPKTENDAINPLTAYARSKVNSEIALAGLAGNHFIVTCLRFATACGMSPRIRMDLVLNDFVASALSLNRIDILSDGTPWRPLIDVNDMSRAIDWASTRTAGNGGNFLVVNAGANKANYTVKQLAYAVQEFLPKTTIGINENAAPDKRSYKVDFSLFESLAPNHTPLHSLDDSITDLINGLNGFNDTQFRNSYFIRLNVLKSLKQRGIVDEDLFYITH